MRKGFLRCIAVVMIIFMTAVIAPITEVSDLFAVEADAATLSGSLGGKVTWKYDTITKKLEISGSGNMSNYSSTPSDFTKEQTYKVIITYRTKIYENATEIVVKSGVTNIGNNVFNGFKKVKKVTIPASVTSIGTSSFANCPALATATMNSGLKTIGTSAFKSTKLSKVTIPSTVTSIGTSAFEGCSSLTSATISSGVKTIGASAFKGTKLSSVSIPKTVTSIGTSAFESCSSLASVTITSGVQTIGASAFKGTKLSSVSIPKTVTSIGASAFESCSFLTSATISSGVKTIGTGAFKNTKLSKISIPATVTSIGTSAFENCSSLTSVTIASGVQTIGSNAFKNTKATKITVPASVTSVGTGAFSGISGLKITCNYGTAAYNYCVKNSVSCTLTENTLVSDVVYDTAKKTATVTLKIVYNNTKLINAGSFTLTYTNATPVDTKTVNKVDDRGNNDPNDDITTVVAYNGTGKVSISMMTLNNVSVSTKTGVCEYTLAELKFKVNCKDTANLNFKANALMMNEAKVSIKSASTTAKLAHTYKTTTTPATLAKSGSVKTACKVCGFVKSNTQIRYVKTVSLSTTSYTYDGAVKTPAVTVKDANGKTLKNGTDYSVSYASGRKNAGTYKVTVTLKGNYSGSKTLTFKINPISISKCTVKLSATSYTYNGSVKTPSVTVKSPKGTTLTKGTHYTVTYASGRKSVGAYKVTVTMKGNYSGSKTLTMYVLPSKTSKITPTATTTTLKATWNKVTGASGYRVELLNASGKVVKKVTTSKLTYTFSGLSAGTTYKVRVSAYKTISGVNKYSLSSTTLTTATKPATPTLKVSSTTKGKASLTWTNVAGETGYQVYYSTKKDSGFKSVASYKTDVLKGSKSSLTSKKTYYFKVRAYKKVGNTVIYGSWSSVKSVKIK